MKDANISEAAIWHKLTAIFHDVFTRDDIALTREMNASDIDGWDSFKQVEIIIATQDAFGIKLTTRDIDNLRQVGDIVELVMKKMQTQ